MLHRALPRAREALLVVKATMSRVDEDEGVSTSVLLGLCPPASGICCISVLSAGPIVILTAPTSLALTASP